MFLRKLWKMMVNEMRAKQHRLNDFCATTLYTCTLIWLGKAQSHSQVLCVLVLLFAQVWRIGRFEPDWTAIIHILMNFPMSNDSYLMFCLSKWIPKTLCLMNDYCFRHIHA